MVSKNPILPQRLRSVPRQFSWVDQRLVRERYIDRLSHPAAALYLFLITVGDAKGMSYYGDKAIMQRLTMDITTLQEARDNLLAVGLIAWKKPLYQVLSLQQRMLRRQQNMAEPLSVGEIFKKAAGGAP